MNAKLVKNIKLSETKRKLKIKKKHYFQKDKENTNEYHKKYVKNRIKIDVNIHLIVYTRNRFYKSLKGMINYSSSRDVLGIVVDTYRKWIEFQFTPEMNWYKIEKAHVKPILSLIYLGMKN